MSAETPDRRGGGGQRRQFHQLRVLLEGGIGVHVATLEGPQDDTSIRSLCRVTRLATSGRVRGLRAHPGLARLLASGSFEGAVVAHVESVPLAARALAGARIPWLVDFHNVNSRWLESVGEGRRAAAWRRRERRALRAAHAATACSEEEREVLLGVEPGASVRVAGHGVDPAEWPERALAPERRAAVALFGAWGHDPNREAAEWLADAVWPAVRAAVPEAGLVLAGPGEPPSRCLAAPGVEAVGRVDDLAPLLGGVRVVAVPIRRGIGARVKFGEALASGAGVVSTSAGAEGYDAEGAFVRADDPERFAEACVSLLRDEGAARALGARGRALALERFRWERTAEPLVRFAEAPAA